MEQLPDYQAYHLSRAEKMKYWLLAAVVIILVIYIFFNSWLLALAFAPGAFFYLPYQAKVLARQRRQQLNLQFKDALQSLQASIGSGRSLESAFHVVLEDLRLLYPEEDNAITLEMAYLCRRLALNQPLEQGLLDFGQRSGVEDILHFAEVIAIAKSTGGNLMEVIHNTAKIISAKISISEDIELSLVKQRFEQKILNIMPILFIGLLKFGGSGYMDSLYTSPTGYVLMGVALILLVAANLAAKRLVEIEV